MPTDRFEEQAREIYRNWCETDGDRHNMTDLIASALRSADKAAREVPPGFVRVGAVDHKVLGSLPMTADGRIVGDGARLYADVGVVATHYVTSSSWPSPPFEPAADGWYSTKEAAEAARGGGEEGEAWRGFDNEPDTLPEYRDHNRLRAEMGVK